MGLAPADLAPGARASDTGLPHGSAARHPLPVAPATADAILVALWLAFGASAAAFGARYAWGAPRPLSRRRGSGAWGFAILLVGVASFVGVERAGGRVFFSAALGWLGCAIALGAVGLYAFARVALGPLWSGPVTIREGHRIVREGPYGRVRHPIYAALLLLVAGTALAHPSRATLLVAVGTAIGVGLKIPREERALRAALGSAYAEYAREVPALVPWRVWRRPSQAAGRV
jgi:protein-S-isoprenylcysteine O-methyltransferase Ste14